MRVISSILFISLLSLSSYGSEDEFYAKGKLNLELTYLGKSFQKIFNRYFSVVTVVPYWGMTLIDGSEKGVFDRGYTSKLKTKNLKVKVSVIGNSYGEDRLDIVLVSSNKKGCNSFLLKLKAIKEEDGIFSLYLSSATETLKKNGIYAVGEMQIGSAEVKILINKRLALTTSGRLGEACNWVINEASALNLHRER